MLARKTPADKARAGAPAAIQLYTWPTPNGRKVSIMLEECGLAYETHLIDLQAGKQFGSAFLAISPNNKIPAIIDPDGPDGSAVTLFESGAILQYLARKTGRFYGAGEAGRILVDQWLFWQAAGLGPMAEQAQHFTDETSVPQAYAQARFSDEVSRLYGVLEARLARTPCLAGDYSIADMACVCWILQWRRQGQHIGEFPNISRWLTTLEARPAVARALAPEAAGAGMRRELPA